MDQRRKPKPVFPPMVGNPAPVWTYDAFWDADPEAVCPVDAIVIALVLQWPYACTDSFVPAAVVSSCFLIRML
jgi:hypothetical protein